MLKRLLISALGLCSLASIAAAQAPLRVRGVVERADATTLRVLTRSDQHVDLRLNQDTKVTEIAPLTIDAIKPGSYIGTAAVAQPDGTLKALEVQVFPESMRGVGEGHQAWDLGPNSSMTNGTVGNLKVADGRRLTLTYKGGEQTVIVPDKAPIITYEPGSRADLTQGAHVIITATQDGNEAPTATRIGVGKNGLVPPM